MKHLTRLFIGAVLLPLAGCLGEDRLEIDLEDRVGDAELRTRPPETGDAVTAGCRTRLVVALVSTTGGTIALLVSHVMHDALETPSRRAGNAIVRRASVKPSCTNNSRWSNPEVSRRCRNDTAK